MNETQRDLTQLETLLVKAILRWHRARAHDRPRHEETAAERNLARVAEALQKVG